jgi:hypothetical protein
MTSMKFRPFAQDRRAADATAIIGLITQHLHHPDLRAAIAARLRDSDNEAIPEIRSQDE